MAKELTSCKIEEAQQLVKQVCCVLCGVSAGSGVQQCGSAV
jgi:hypothetical protein